MNIKEILIRQIYESGFMRNQLFEIIEEKKIVDVEIETFSDESVSLEQKAVNYCLERGMSTYPDNIERVKQFLLKQKSNNAEVIKKVVKQEITEKKPTSSILENATTEELRILLESCNLYVNNQILCELVSKKTLPSTRYEYDIETIRDLQHGETNIPFLLDIIQKRAKDGWCVKNIFANELGKNAFSVMNVGVNSTISEIIVLFERIIPYS